MCEGKLKENFTKEDIQLIADFILVCLFIYHYFK